MTCDTLATSMRLLRELRNCFSCIICVRSLFCSVRVYVSHFPPNSFGKTVFVFLCCFFVFIYKWFSVSSFSVLFRIQCRRSRPKVFCKKDVLRNFIKFTGKHLCQSLLFNKDAGLKPATLLKRKLWHRCFPVNFMRLLRKLFFRTPLVAACVNVISKDLITFFNFFVFPLSKRSTKI